MTQTHDPSQYLKLLASTFLTQSTSLPSTYAIIFGETVQLQRLAKKFANLAKQDPGRARQKSQARAGTNFSQPRTNSLADLCT